MNTMLAGTKLNYKPFAVGQPVSSHRAQKLQRGTKEERASERDEQWEAQQAIIKARRDGSWKKDVEARRAEVRKYAGDPVYKKKVDEERRARKKKEAEANPVPKFGIIIPIVPFGMPEYDGGERFDLRLPHVDNGWVDEDAAFGKTMKRIFGRKKKADPDSKGKK